MVYLGRKLLIIMIDSICYVFLKFGYSTCKMCNIIKIINEMCRLTLVSKFSSFKTINRPGVMSRDGLFVSEIELFQVFIFHFQIVMYLHSRLLSFYIH